MAIVQGIDLDFVRYVARRRGDAAERAWGSAGYAYAGDAKLRRTLGRVTPVTLAVEATERAWRGLAKSELLGRCVKVTDKQFPKLDAIAVHCAQRLGIERPDVYVSPDIGQLNAYTLGTNEDAHIVISGALIDHLDETELTAVVGHECGHVHNDHVVYSTALHYMQQGAGFFLKWVVAPAVLALQAWFRRAEITCDRAGLICTQDLGKTTSALVKLALGSKKLSDEVDLDEYMKQLDEGKTGLGKYAELWNSHPYLPKRVQALRVLAEGAYYRGMRGESGGPSRDIVDQRVADIVKVMG